MRCVFRIHQIPNLLRQVALGKMRPGYIDRNRHAGITLIHPFLLVSCHTADHIGIDLGDKAILFKNRDNGIRAFEAVDRRLPANQCLGAAQPVGLGIVLRLVEYHKFLIPQCSLLVFLYDIQPLLFFDHLIVKEGDRRIVIVGKGLSCGAGIVVLLLQVGHPALDQPELPYLMPFPDHTHTDMETEAVDTVHDLQIL